MVKGKHSASSSDKANKTNKRQKDRRISWHQCQCSGSSQIPSQDDLNYHQFLKLYKVIENNDRAELVIYDIENKQEEVKILDADLRINQYASTTQLPNGELFCYDNNNSGITFIIDRNYGIRMLPFGARCCYSSTLYFDNNIYCFGGYDQDPLALARKFDLKNNRWIKLVCSSNVNSSCHSVIFNGNILISGFWSTKLWLYSIEIDSYSIIPNEFSCGCLKFLINVERLYLIEWGNDRLIYDSEDEYHWKPISKSGKLYDAGNQFYCLYNKEKIYISTGFYYYQFDLKEKILRKIK